MRRFASVAALYGSTRPACRALRQPLRRPALRSAVATTPKALAALLSSQGRRGGLRRVR